MVEFIINICLSYFTLPLSLSLFPNPLALHSQLIQQLMTHFSINVADIHPNRVSFTIE